MRSIPETFSDEDRKCFKAVAERARVEKVHVYTILSLGLQIYLHNDKASRFGPKIKRVKVTLSEDKIPSNTEPITHTTCN